MCLLWKFTWNTHLQHDSPSDSLTRYFIMPPVSLSSVPLQHFLTKATEPNEILNKTYLPVFVSQSLILQIGMGQQYTAQWYPTSCWCHWSYNTGINWDEISRGWDFSTASLNGFHYNSPTPQLCYVKAAILRVSVAPPQKPSGVEYQVFNCSCSTCL